MPGTYLRRRVVTVQITAASSKLDIEMPNTGNKELARRVHGHLDVAADFECT